MPRRRRSRSLPRSRLLVRTPLSSQRGVVSQSASLTRFQSLAVVPAPHAAVSCRDILRGCDARGRVLWPARVRYLVHVRDGGHAGLVVDLRESEVLGVCLVGVVLMLWTWQIIEGIVTVVVGAISFFGECYYCSGRLDACGGVLLIGRSQSSWTSRTRLRSSHQRNALGSCTGRVRLLVLEWHAFSEALMTPLTLYRVRQLVRGRGRAL